MLGAGLGFAAADAGAGEIDDAVTGEVDVVSRGLVLETDRDLRSIPAIKVDPAHIYLGTFSVLTNSYHDAVLTSNAYMCSTSTSTRTKLEICNCVQCRAKPSKVELRGGCRRLDQVKPDPGISRVERAIIISITTDQSELIGYSFLR